MEVETFALLLENLLLLDHVIEVRLIAVLKTEVKELLRSLHNYLSALSFESLQVKV